MRSTRKLSSSRPRRTWTTHDNGGRPFLVEDYGGHVIVYKQIPREDLNGYEETPKRLFQQPYTRLFVGTKPAWQDPRNWPSDGEGNSILLEISKGRYMFIGHEIATFHTEGRERINEYWSEIGNSDVPYPFAVGEDHVYILLDYKVFPKETFDLERDVYAQYYMVDRVRDCKFQKSFRKTDFCKRLARREPTLMAQLNRVKTSSKAMRRTIKQKRQW